MKNNPVLVDTLIWVDHFNRGDYSLEYLLNENKVVMHHFIIGELACGNIKNRKLIFNYLNALPVIPEITEEEFYLFLDKHHLFGIGLGFIDIHILAASLISGCLLYTRDKILFSSANKFKIAYK